MLRRGLFVNPYLTTFVHLLSQLKMSGCHAKVEAGQGELHQLLFLHRAVEQEQGLAFLPLFTLTPTTSTPLHHALTRRSRSEARCCALLASLPARRTLESLSPLPSIHPRGAVLALSLHIRHPPIQTELQDPGGDSAQEQHVAISGLLPTQ